MQQGYRDDLRGTSWLGRVVDADDPMRLGRARVMVFGKFDELATEDIPWARPATAVTFGSASGGGFMSVPKVGSIVEVEFSNGDLYHPEYRYAQELSQELRDEASASYANAHFILYDTATDGSVKLFFTEGKGLVLHHKGSEVRLDADRNVHVRNANGDEVSLLKSGDIRVKAANSVTVECKDARITASDSIHLDCDKNASIKLGANVSDALVLGDKFMALFNAHTHTGNLMYPTSPPVTPMTQAHLSKKVRTQ